MLMMGHSYDIADSFNRIDRYISDNSFGYKAFRRRAILVRSAGETMLFICTVEALTNSPDEQKVSNTLSYRQATLHEDLLTTDQLIEFIHQINSGKILLGEWEMLAQGDRRQWAHDHVGRNNNHMLRSGHVFSVQFQEWRGVEPGPLLAPNLPYYPDITEAARDWLPFAIYHGYSDSRKGEIVLLFPETRAFFNSFIVEGELLQADVSGNVVDNTQLSVKGAWWDEHGIHHIDQPVSKAKAVVSLPRNTSRLEFVLTDASGEIYDFEVERNYQFGGVWSRQNNNADLELQEKVKQACQQGEGLFVEFKPFMEIEGKRSEKLKELFQTVVSFANTKGGEIYLGINDDCEIVGINEPLAKHVSAAPSADSCEQYMGALRGRVRDAIVGEFDMNFKQTVVDQRIVAIIEVAQAKEKPVYIKQDQYFYVRRGSSNAKAFPDEWRLMLSENRLGENSLSGWWNN